MHSFKILILIGIFNPVFAFGRVDSCRHNRNLIEIGEAYVNLFDGNGYVFALNPNFSYTRFWVHEFFTKAEYYHYDVPNEKVTKSGHQATGDVLSTNFRTVRIGLGKEFNIKKFLIAPYLCANYRWGFGENVVAFFDPKYSWEMKGDRNPMKSFGCGAGMKISYIFHKHYSLGLEGNYSYNNEKRHFVLYPNNMNDGIDRFQPNRRYSTLQIKVGYLF